MKKYLNVSFQYSESVYCANIAHAESAEAVEAHYSAKYEWCKVSEATAADVEEAQRRGKPIIEIEPAPKMELKNYTIKDIESMSAADLASFADEVETIKGHTVYYIDFGGYFGFSACVTADGRHIYYANDYELHHGGKSRDELREIYRRKLSGKLFTDEELQTVNSYDDYTAKSYYIRNYYAMRRPYISAFFIGSDAERAEIEKKTEKMVFSPVFMAFYAPENADFVKRGAELLRGLDEAEQRNKENAEYWKSAFLSEMYNHEYGINWQADYDVISCFGNCEGVKDYTDRAELFAACGFNATQRSAYDAARREYYRQQKNAENY